MANLPLGRGAYKRTTGREPEVRLVNRFFEDNPTNFENGVALLSRPGTTLFKELGTGPIRRLWTQKGTFAGALFAVSGDTLYRINTDRSVEEIDGTIAGDGSPEIDGTADTVFIADGTSLQYYSGSGAAASGTLTLTGNAANNETVTIGDQVYTWKTTLTGPTAAYEVLIGASASDSLDNLIAAINFASGGGTLYGSETPINLDVVAKAGPADTMVVEAKVNGLAGNSVATLETMANGSWGSSSLTGGTSGLASNLLTLTGNAVDGETVTIGSIVYTWRAALTGPAVAYEVLIGATAADSVDNITAAINQDGGIGTTYSDGTAFHPDVRATADPGDILRITARAGGSAYNAIATTETMTNATWASATMTGGANATLRQIAVPDNLAVVSLGVLNSYVIVVVSNDERWYYMDPGALFIDPLSFYTAEAKPDELINVVIVGDQAWLCGEETLEVWYVSGVDPDDPFDRVQQRAFSRGVLEGSVVRISDQVLLVGDDLVAYSLTGGPLRISTHGIEERIRAAVKTIRSFDK